MNDIRSVVRLEKLKITYYRELTEIIKVFAVKTKGFIDFSRKFCSLYTDGVKGIMDWVI